VLKMKNRRFGGLTAGVGLFFIFFLASPISAQNLSQLYVSPVGYVLGAIFDANPGFSSDIYVSNAGQLVWIEMAIPHALIEVYADGYIRLVEEEASANVAYEGGLIRRIGDVRFHYDDNGRVSEIGDVHFDYESGQLRRMDDLRFHRDEFGRIRSIGSLGLTYADERIHKIGDLTFLYDDNGLIQNIGGVRFDYEYGRLREVTGHIPGVGVTVTWVVEFRKKLSKY
jgi:hypothetical protein